MLKSLFQILFLSVSCIYFVACGQPSKPANGSGMAASVNGSVSQQLHDTSLPGTGQIQIVDPAMNQSQDLAVTNNQSLLSPLFPMALDNYWVYGKSDDASYSDTLKIISKRLYQSNTWFEFNNGQILFEKNDTIYNLQPVRGGKFISSVQYFPSAIKKEFQIMLGGDATTYRTVFKLEKPYNVWNKNYDNCWRFEQHGENGIDFEIISRGVGFIERNKNNQHLILKSYHITQ